MTIIIELAKLPERSAKKGQNNPNGKGNPSQDNGKRGHALILGYKFFVISSPVEIPDAKVHGT